MRRACALVLASVALVLAQALTVDAQAQAARAQAAAPAAPGDARKWLPLARDGVHDPAAPGTKLKQAPAEALSKLPADTAGNLVLWVRALDEGAIDPRSTLRAGGTPELRDDAIFVSRFGAMPAVRFPHRAHTQWLACSNCHEKLFVSKAGANKLSMQKILDGEQCGLCHGAVAFPLTECNRCHNTPNELLRRVGQQ